MGSGTVARPSAFARILKSAVERDRVRSAMGRPADANVHRKARVVLVAVGSFVAMGLLGLALALVRSSDPEPELPAAAARSSGDPVEALERYRRSPAVARSHSPSSEVRREPDSSMPAPSEPPAFSWARENPRADDVAREKARARLGEHADELEELAIEQFLEMGLDPLFAEFVTRRYDVELRRNELGQDEADRRLDELAAEYEELTGVAWELAEQRPPLLRDDAQADASAAGPSRPITGE